MHSYQQPPILDITLEEFETFAIDRLRILSYIESLQHRSLPYAQFQTQIATYLKTHLPLSSNTARSANLEQERRADEIGHWVLRLAFCRSYVYSFSCESFYSSYLAMVCSWCRGRAHGLLHRETEQDRTRADNQTRPPIPIHTVRNSSLQTQIRNRR